MKGLFLSSFLNDISMNDISLDNVTSQHVVQHMEMCLIISYEWTSPPAVVDYKWGYPEISYFTINKFEIFEKENF